MAHETTPIIEAQSPMEVMGPEIDEDRNFGVQNMLGSELAPVFESPNTVSQNLDDLKNQVAPDMSDAELAQAQILAVRRLSGAGSTPGVEKSRADFSQNKSTDPSLIMEAKTIQGDDPIESMGGLLSLVVPVLAGAAIGGKRGALYAAEGAGKQALEGLKERREERADDRASVRDLEEAKELQGLRLAGQKEIEGIRQENKIPFEEELRRERAKLRQRSLLKNLEKAEADADSARGFLTVGEQILQDFSDLTGAGTGKKMGVTDYANFQIKKRFSASDVGELQARVDGLIFDIVKAKQGSRPSDFDVQALMKIVKGDFTANPQKAYDLLKNALNDSRGFTEARLEAAKARFEGREPDGKTLATINKADEKRVVQRELNALSSDTAQKLVKLSKAGFSKKDIKEAMSRMGTPVSDALLTSLEFK